jgi:hypothetical protein
MCYTLPPPLLQVGRRTFYIDREGFAPEHAALLERLLGAPSPSATAAPEEGVGQVVQQQQQHRYAEQQQQEGR